MWCVAIELAVDAGEEERSTPNASRRRVLSHARLTIVLTTQPHSVHPSHRHDVSLTFSSESDTISLSLAASWNVASPESSCCAVRSTCSFNHIMIVPSILTVKKIGEVQKNITKAEQLCSR